MKIRSDDMPASELFLGSCRAVENEINCELKPTFGKIPSSLNGTLYRNGPGRFSIGADSYSHVFDGDGMISSFQISKGQVRYKNAYVKTSEFVSESAAGRMLFRGFGSNIPGGIIKNIFRMRFKNAANTNVVSHAGRLFALWEGGWPHEISPDSLRTIGRHSFDGHLENKSNRVDQFMNPELPFSAHPKVDPTTGHLYNFGLAFGLKNRLMIYRIDRNGQMHPPRFLNLKHLSFIHDFLITADSKAIFFATPIHFGLFSMLTGLRSPADAMAGNLSAPVQIMVVDLNGPAGQISDSAVEIFEAPHSFMFHHINAFEEAGKIHIYTSDMESFPSAASARKALSGLEVEYPLTRLAHYILTPGEKQAEKRILPVQGFELPRFDDSRTGLPFNSFFATGVSRAEKFPMMDEIQNISIDGEVLNVFAYAEGLVGEPVFVATKEGQFILSVCYNHRFKNSELIILRAENLALVARAPIPHSQPLGFHGNWVDALDCSK